MRQSLVAAGVKIALIDNRFRIPPSVFKDMHDIEPFLFAFLRRLTGRVRAPWTGRWRAGRTAPMLVLVGDSD
jgi:hypothetical protein